MDNGVMGGGRSAPRLSRRGRLLLAVAVPAVAALEAYAQRPLWEHYAALAVINLATLVTFLITGVLLNEEPGQRGSSWALALAGIARPLGWLNQWGSGPLPHWLSQPRGRAMPARASAQDDPRWPGSSFSRTPVIRKVTSVARLMTAKAA